MFYLCAVNQTNDVFPALGVENDLTAIFDKDELMFFFYNCNVCVM